MHSLLEFCRWLNGTPWSVYLRESDNPFPIIESVHIIGLALSVGVVMWLDLRFLNVAMRDEPIVTLVEQLEPLAMAGFAVMFVSGALLFLAEPLKCYSTLAFRLKLVMLALTALNVAYFRTTLYRRLVEFDRSPTPPWQLKLVGFVSLLFWFGIIVAGRWTAYL